MVVATDAFSDFVRGHWLDSMGNSIMVSNCSEDKELKAVLTPLIDHPEARDKVLAIRYADSKIWRCGSANLEWCAEQRNRLVWVTEDGRRNIWSRRAPESPQKGSGLAFPWMNNTAEPEPWLPLEVPRDILYDGARVAALLDIRQMIGPKPEAQERLTHILMDHDLHPMRGDYLIPGAGSPLWQTLPVPEVLRKQIAQRILRIPHEALSQRVSWSGDNVICVGSHKITVAARDIQTLDARWVLPPKDPRKPLEIARLLALYSVFDNPLSNRRNGVHLGLEPGIRQHCDYELFASPLNAAVPNGRFASKWPHVEWRFGSIGSYPSVVESMPMNSVVCVNPPFTEAYLADVMDRLGELKLRFRLRIAIPIQDMPWREKLHSSMPAAQLLKTYYDASSENQTEVLHPTLLWEDPRCPPRDGSAMPAAPVGSGVVLQLPASMVTNGPSGYFTTDKSAAVACLAAAMAAATASLPVKQQQQQQSEQQIAPQGAKHLAPASQAQRRQGTQGQQWQQQRPAARQGAVPSGAARPSSAGSRSARSAGASPRPGPAGPARSPGRAATPPVPEAKEPEAPALDAEEWPSLSLAKEPSRKSVRAKR